MLYVSRGRVAAAVSIVLCAGALGACGSDDDPSNNSGGSSASSSAPGVKAASAVLADAKGKAGNPPTSSPTPAKAKNVWYIGCAQILRPCQRAGEEIQKAGKALGWKVTVVDGKADPSVWNRGFGQAIVAGADAIVTGGVDCPPVAQSLAKAKAKGIVTVSLFSYDCNDPAFGGKGKALYDHITQTGPAGTTMADTGQLMGKVQAAWAIRDSGGKAKVIQLAQPGFAVTNYVGKGFTKELGTCSGCKIVDTVTIKPTDVGAPITQKTRTALLQHPDATYVAAANDVLALGASQAVNQSGRAGKVKVQGTNGDPANVALIKGGRGQVMSSGVDTGFIGWGAMDDLVRIFAKQKPVYSGWSVGVVDKPHLPSGKEYKAPVDYETTYPKAWGR